MVICSHLITLYIVNHHYIYLWKREKNICLNKLLVPNHQILSVKSYNNFNIDKPQWDFFIWEEQEAIAWTISNPNYHVVYPKSFTKKESLSYPIRLGDSEFLNFLNSWLALKESDGFKESQYRLWIMGKTAIAVPPNRRWSILDDVLYLNNK